MTRRVQTSAGLLVLAVVGAVPGLAAWLLLGPASPWADAALSVAVALAMAAGWVGRGWWNRAVRR